MAVNRCTKEGCQYFNRALPSNAKVCPGCGIPLGIVAPKPQIQQLQQPQAQPAPQPAPQPTPELIETSDHTQCQPRPPVEPTPTPQPVYTPPPARLPVLKLIHSSNRQFQWSGETGIIGRRSPSKNIVPDIDLTGIENEGIVSRSHARLSWDWTQNCYMIVDLNSTNGVYLNGIFLNPGVPYRLINGDSLQFGQDNLVNFTVSVL